MGAGGGLSPALSPTQALTAAKVDLEPGDEQVILLRGSSSDASSDALLCNRCVARSSAPMRASDTSHDTATNVLHDDTAAAEVELEPTTSKVGVFRSDVR